MVFLQEWDSAHKVAQSCMLNSFIKSKGASLILAQLTVWLRMMQVTLLALFPLFLQPCSHRYLTEFLENRSVLIPLEILGLNHMKEEDKRESVKLLLLTGDTGRECEELICESCGIRRSKRCTDLGHSNPKYQSQDSQCLIAVLFCTFPQAQQGALQMLWVMQVRSGPCWGQQALLPPVSIPAQAGAVPVSSALWLH
uniref:Uncharacterized protein n=1 Tax=Corvus moneduloides TaxID=1196302 RepID=A0A8C3EG30_CORMO